MRAILTSVSPKAFVVVGSTVTKKPPGPPRVKKCSIGRRGRAAPSWYEVETMRAQRFDADDVATIKRLAEKGFPAVVIAKALSGDRTAEAVRKKCVQVGISLRPDKLHHEVRAAVDSHVWAHLHRHALRRGVTVARLTRTIVTVLAIDGLIDALLDDKPR